MTVLLVLAFFVVLISMDYVVTRQRLAREAKALLTRLDLRSAKRPGRSETRFFVSDEPENFRVLGERFLGTPIQSVAKVGDHLNV